MKTFCIGRRILHSENNHLPRTAFTVLHLFCLQHPATMPIQCRKQLKSFPLLWSTGCSNSSGKSVPSAKVQQPATEASLISNMTPLWMEPEISGWTSFAEKSQIASRLNLALLIHMSICFFGLNLFLFSARRFAWQAQHFCLRTTWLKYVICLALVAGWPKACKGQGYLDFMTKMAQVFRLKFKYQQWECQKKTRRRMARERRGAESSVVSMETLYYKTIY